MLCFTRTVGQTIVIGKPGDVLTEPIVITVAPHRETTHGGWDRRPRLGVEAQADVVILRGELLEKETA